MSNTTFIPTDEQREAMEDYFFDIKETCEAMLGENFDKEYIKQMLNAIAETL